MAILLNARLCKFMLRWKSQVCEINSGRMQGIYSFNYYKWDVLMWNEFGVIL